MKSTSRTEIPAPAAGGGGTATAGPGAGDGVVSARLAEAAGLADDRDRLSGRLLRLLISVRVDDAVPAALDGMSLHVWLKHTARCTHGEARDLLGAADTLASMPATVTGLCDGWLSWSQTLAIAKAARGGAGPVAW